MIGGTLFLSTNSVLYGEAGVTSLLFTSDGSLVNIPYFTVISMGLTVLYIITSSIFIRKVSFEKRFEILLDYYREKGSKWETHLHSLQSFRHCTINILASLSLHA